MKKYPLKITSIYEFESGSTTPLSYVTKGHVDLLDFDSELMKNWNRVVVNRSKIYHGWQRAVPSGLEKQSILIFCDGPARGAYPCTYVQFEDTKEV